MKDKAAFTVRIDSDLSERLDALVAIRTKKDRSMSRSSVVAAAIKQYMIRLDEEEKTRIQRYLDL
jgi:predicted transcriptional regulator